MVLRIIRHRRVFYYEYKICNGTGLRIGFSEGRKRSGLRPRTTGCSWMPLSIVTEREYREETCPENSVIGKVCIYGIPVGQKREYGKGYFTNFLWMPTTNMRQKTELLSRLINIRRELSAGIKKRVYRQIQGRLDDENPCDLRRFG